jgi:hypothetical protein
MAVHAAGESAAENGGRGGSRQGALRQAAMRTKYAFVLILLACMCLAQRQMMAAEPVTMRSALNALTSELVAGHIQRADIFFMPHERLTYSRVTPQMLEAQADKRFTLEISTAAPEGLVRAIEGIRLHETTDPADLRWGMIFWDRSGNRVHSIYLNSRYIFETGRRGYIDGVLVGFNASLIDWLESNYLK